jgi:hypothetical protein
MELFIESNKSEALSALTSAYTTLTAQLTSVKALYSTQKERVGRLVKHGHELEYPRLRELEVAEILLSEANAALFVLIEPLKVAYISVQTEIPPKNDISGRYARATTIGMNNVICARDLYEESAALYYEIDLRQNSCLSHIGLEREYERSINAPDHRLYTVRFNKQQVFTAPFMNPDEVWKLNCWSHGQVAITGDVQDVTTGKLVNDHTIHQAFQKTKSGTGGGAGVNGSYGQSESSGSPDGK